MEGIGKFHTTKQQVSSCKTIHVADRDSITLTEQNMLSQVGYQLSSEGLTGDIPGVGQ